MKKFAIGALVLTAVMLGSALTTQAVATGTSALQLTAGNITITPAILKVNTTATFKAKVENKGTASATSTKVRFFINEKLIGEKTIATISKNSYGYATLTYKIPAGMKGEQTLYVTVGDEKVKPEETGIEGLIKIEIKEDANNLKYYKIRAEKKFTVTVDPPLLPDLSVVPADLKITPASYKGGDKIYLKAVVRNLGTDKATNFKVQFFLKGANVFNKTITTLSKKANATVTYTYQLPVNLAGTMPFKVVVDTDKKVTEANEKNNEAEINASVAQAQIDLLVDSLKTSISKPKAGQKVSIQAKIKNNGNTDAANVPLYIYLGKEYGQPIFTANMKKIAKNSVSSQSFSWTIPTTIPGSNYEIRAVTDPTNVIIETNEINNEKLYNLNLTAVDLVVQAHPDLGLPRLIYKGYDTGANLRIRNNNVLPATNVNIGLFYIMPGQNNVIKTLKTEALGTIAKNAYRDVFLSGRVDQSIPIGTMINIFAQVDYNKVVPETNEENNKLEYSIPILERPRQLSCPCLQIIVNDEDGEPMNKATVTLAGATTSETKITGAENWYNSNGSVIFENRPATASYSVTVASSSYRTQSQSFNYDKNNDDTTYRYFNMDKKALVTGQVKNHIGQPLPWTFVRVDGIGLEAVTDAQGKYGFLLNGGTYNLRFVREGYNRILQNGYVVAPLSAVTLDKTMTPGNTAFMTGNITDDEGNPLYSVDVYVNNTILGMTNQAGKYSINLIGAPGKKITFKKPGFVNTELTEDITGGLEYNYDLVMYKPNTANHVERGTNIVSWHQHEGTPANAYWIPEYNVDIWWGLGNVKMGMDFNKSGNTTKISKLVVNVHGREWECNRVEGEGEVETSAIDIPITIAAGSCSGKQTQMDVYKVAIESGGMEVWSDSSFWTSASDPVNTGTKVFTLNNIPVVWDNDLKVKLWTRVQKKAVIGTDGDGAGALYGYHLDKKLITWYPQKPPTTKISTSWKQVGGYFLGILDNPVNAITGFTDMFTVDQFNQYTMEEVLPQNFPGYIND